MRAYKNGRPGVAFSWCIRGKVSPFLKNNLAIVLLMVLSLACSLHFQDCAFAGFLAEK